MTTQQLHEQILLKKSFLCVGLDPDLTKIPPHLLETEDPIFEFNKAIIDATHDLAVGYKPNTAFFEAYGLKGWLSLQKTINYINENFPEMFTIADAKRIFQQALRCAATGLILCHNHPSGQRKPSPQDEALTKDIKEFASLIDMKLLDHVIFTDNGYFSFADEGVL
mgnify:CR=1 FL=1